MKSLNDRKTTIERLKLTPENKEGVAQIMGRDLKFARRVLGFTQSEIAEVLGVEQSGMSRIESGDQKLCAAQTQVVTHIIAECLGYLAESHKKKEVKRIERIKRIIYGESS